MGAGKNKSHRKKRISKHVLQAEERRKIAEVEKQLIDGAAAATDKENGSAAAVDANASSSPKTKASNVSAHPSSSSPSPSSSAAVAAVAVKNTKNPEDASTYLSTWKYDRANNNSNNKQWKFNKNTQSWLLRHMYNPTKVSKHSFAILVEYLLNGENMGVKNRVLEDAKFRARRYKELEKQQQQLQERGEVEKVEGKDQNAQDDASKKKEAGEQSSSSSPKKVAVVDVSWDKMDEHEKRKEYKRARKVLDAFKEAAVVGGGVGEST